MNQDSLLENNSEISENQADFLNGESLKNCLHTKIFGQTIFYKEEMDSTNREAKRQAAEGAGHGLLILAEQQTMGKGRLGRSWSSPKGTGIWMSLLLKPEELEPNKASMLTLVAALSVAAAVKEVSGLEAFIKWPNDIVINHKKVCGILTEMSSEAEQIHYVIVGIGINVNTREFPEEIRETATSLFIEKERIEREEKSAKTPFLEEMPEEISKDIANRRIHRSLLIAKVMEQLEKNYELFLQTGDLYFLLEKYNETLINRDRQVKILGSKEELTGIAKGINEQGELLVMTEAGLMEVCSGEVSVRGLYGYV